MIRSILLSLLLSVTLCAATPAIRIKLPLERVVGAAPLSLRLAIYLDPQERNRWVCLYAKQTRNGSQEKTSCWEVQAEHEALVTWRDIKDLSAGEWVIAAAVLRNDDSSTLSNRYTIQVTGFGYDLPE